MLEQFMHGFFLPFNNFCKIFNHIPMETIGVVCGILVFAVMVVMLLEIIATLLAGHR